MPDEGLGVVQARIRAVSAGAFSLYPAWGENDDPFEVRWNCIPIKLQENDTIELPFERFRDLTADEAMTYLHIMQVVDPQSWKPEKLASVDIPMFWTIIRHFSILKQLEGTVGARLRQDWAFA